jgi:hypothetical protein
VSPRSETVIRARALCGGALGPRASRLWRRLESDAPLTFDDVAAAPDWILWPAAARRDLARAAGVAACAPALRRTIDGRAFRIFAQVVGPERLDALLAAPAVGDGEPHGDLPGSLEGLAAVGAAALRAEIADRPALARRLATLLPQPATAIEPTLARAACAQARQWAAMDGEARS